MVRDYLVAAHLKNDLYFLKLFYLNNFFSKSIIPEYFIGFQQCRPWSGFDLQIEMHKRINHFLFHQTTIHYYLSDTLFEMIDNTYIPVVNILEYNDV